MSSVGMTGWNVGRNFGLGLTLPLALAAGLVMPTTAQQHAHGAAASKPAARLFEGLGQYHRPIATSNPDAQRYFDQGLTLVYGFNHEEAIRSFEEAARLDPAAPMPHWGIALALGENINSPVDPERAARAYAAVQKARELAKATAAAAGTAGTPGAAGTTGTTPPADAAAVEAAYIEALAVRYSQDPKADPKPLAIAYSEKMKALAAAYPDDLDAATLYAESLMDLKPWQLYSLDGTPSEVTPEVVAVLEGVLVKAPDHPGANHYYIHAVEASNQPERALPSAARLEKLVPAAGHLVHMPAHIYARTGDYKAAADRNAVAAEADRAYIKATGVSEAFYPLMYYTHNLMFLTQASAMAGRYADALASAKQTVEHVGPAVKAMPMVEALTVEPLLVYVRFGKWDEILAAPQPDPSHTIATVQWRYARACAFAGKGDAASGEAEVKALVEARAKVTKDQMIGLNPAPMVLEIAQFVATGRVAEAKRNFAGAIGAFTQAVTKQDLLAYDEPPDFHYPVRESLGGLWLRANEPGEAEAAFRKDLTKNRRNGRSLYGLWQALMMQKKTAEAEMVRLQYEAAWKDADVQLTVKGL
jgi:tetratricopeptide (TPR) repeat protein